MSKAFTREDDNDADSEQPDAPDTALPQGTKNYITPAGANRLRVELTKLMDVDRPEVVKIVSWAAGNGDRSENGDYIYGKKRLREIDRRIRFLNKRLDAAEEIDPTKQNSDRVLFGATVTVADENGVEKTYSIVGIDETDGKKGFISWISPIGKALLKAKVGDSVTLRTPRGEEDLEILKIEYKALS